MGRTTADWEAIEFDYRAGIKPLRMIGEEHGITHGAIRKRAQRDGWTRDIGAKIALKAEELVSKAQVSAEVSKTVLVTELAVVESNAVAIANVMLEHRGDVRRSRALVNQLIAEAEALNVGLEDLLALGQLMSEPDKGGVDKRNEVYQRVISFPGRVDAVRKLVESAKAVIELERRVWRIKDDGVSLDELARKIGEGAALSAADAYAAMLGK